MKEFIKTLFDEKNEISFQYKDYDMIFFAEKFHSFYLIFFLQTENELMELWKQNAEIFDTLKKNNEIYSSDMDKNTMCIYCLKVSEEDYCETELTGTISQLSRKIGKIEEDLNYFAKHVFLYTSKMELFAKKHIGEFDSLCWKYIIDEEFDKYKSGDKSNYKYDFLVNIFIKFPFLSFEKYQIREDKKYQTVESFIQQKIDKKIEDIMMMQEEVDKLEEIIEDETKLFEWLDTLIQTEDNNL